MAEEDPIGTGAAMSHLFAAHGATVAVLDTDAERANRTVESVSRSGGRAEFFHVDVSDEASSASGLEQVESALGRLDGLVNNAAIGGNGTQPIHLADLAEWEAVHKVNLTGVMLMTRAAVPFLAATSGSIVNISSMAAIRNYGTAAYATAKAGVIQLTKESAYSLGPQGIRANCVVPGHIRAPMGGIGDQAFRDHRIHATYLYREGTAWDVAAAALFFLSVEARWITGTVLPVDGGTSNTTSLGTEWLHAQYPPEPTG
jgi:NAD(P)-dependent dehydrogenase (short-subunit alcohol dehydrogenase family)